MNDECHVFNQALCVCVCVGHTSVDSAVMNTRPKAWGHTQISLISHTSFIYTQLIHPSVLIMIMILLSFLAVLVMLS